MNVKARMVLAGAYTGRNRDMERLLMHASGVTFGEQVQAVLDARGVTRGQLAWRARVGAPRVTQALRLEANLTVSTMSTLASALDLELHVLLRRRRVGSVVLGSWSDEVPVDPEVGLAA